MMNYNIPLPRVLNSSLGEVRRLNVVDATVNLNIMPLSTATVTLPDEDSLTLRSWVEMFTSQGSAGIFRVRAPGRNYGASGHSYQLDHGIVEVGDWIIKGEADYKGAANSVIPQIWAHYGGSKWQLGSVNSTRRVTYSGDYGNVLSALIDVVEQLPGHMLKLDQTTTPWTVSVVSRSSTVSGEGRLGRNVISAKISEDDSNLCTRLHWQGAPSGSGEQQTIPTGYIDADTKSTYGIVEQYAGIEEGETQAQMLSRLNLWLDQHKEPLIAVSIELQDLKQITGETYDGFEIGKMYRLALPDHERTVELTLVTANWAGVYSNPGRVMLTLGNAELSVSGAYTGSTSGGGGSASTAASTSKSKSVTKAANHDHVKTVEINGIMHQAGLEWDENHALIFAKNKAGDLGEMYGAVETTAGKVSLVATEEQFAQMARDREEHPSQWKSMTARIDVNASDITSRVTYTDFNGSEIVSRINQTAEAVTIDAKYINLNGYVTATQLAASLGTTEAGFVKILQANAFTLNNSTFRLDGQTVRLIPRTIDGVSFTYLGVL